MRKQKVVLVFLMAVAHGVTGVWLARSLKELKKTY